MKVSVLGAVGVAVMCAKWMQISQAPHALPSLSSSAESGFRAEELQASREIEQLLEKVRWDGHLPSQGGLVGHKLDSQTSTLQAERCSLHSRLL